jgi:hypothetical protein
MADPASAYPDGALAKGIDDPLPSCNAIRPELALLEQHQRLVFIPADMPNELQRRSQNGKLALPSLAALGSRRVHSQKGYVQHSAPRSRLSLPRESSGVGRRRSGSAF